MSMPDLTRFQAWTGQPQRSNFKLDPWPAAALSAALDRDDAPASGDPLPPFWHHLYGLPVVRAAETGPDGHPKRGGFLPPVPLPRRMWAGGRLTFPGTLRIGDEVERVSEVKSVTAKQGRQGPLVFVLVEHRFSTAHGLALVEEHDVVYREPPKPGSEAAPARADKAGTWQKGWRPDEVLLFRYSALTYNGHRIHYDLRYVTEEEGYPGLIVHGPLLATLMLDLVRRERPDSRVARFTFRALSPLFAGEDLIVHGAPEGSGAALWISGPDGRLVMQGEVTFDSDQNA